MLSDTAAMRKGPGPPVSDCVYIFLDESGNLDFSARGTRYFVLTSVSMERPFPMYEALDAYKYDCLEYGLTTEYFHCANDNRHVRTRVFDIIGSHLDHIAVDSLIVEKRKTEPSLIPDGRFYAEMLGSLLRRVLSRESNSEGKEVIVITDTVPFRRRREALEKSVRLTLSKAMPERLRYRVLHHDSRAHYGLQIADYVCWAVFRKYERGQSDFYDRISPAVLSRTDVFQNETRAYY